MRTATVTRNAVFWLTAPVNGSPVPVNVTLSWSTDTPYAVTMLFHSRNRPEWTVGRQLLGNSLTGRSGAGDVSFAPIPGLHVIEMILNSPSGHARFLIAREDLVEFLGATWKIVPAHAEMRITDRELQELTAN